MIVGRSHASTPDFLACVYQIAFLEGGPTIKGIERWMDSVSAILFDLGIESLLVRMVSMLEVCFGNVAKEDITKTVSGTLAFKNAIGIAGPNHAIDWIEQEICTRCWLLLQMEWNKPPPLLPINCKLFLFCMCIFCYTLSCFNSFARPSKRIFSKPTARGGAPGRQQP